MNTNTTALMSLKILAANTLCLGTLALASTVQAAMPVDILPSTHWGAANLEFNRISELVREQASSIKDKSTIRSYATTANARISRSSGTELDSDLYRRAKVRIQYGQDGYPDYVVSHFLRKDSWSYDTVRMDLDGQYDVIDITTDYSDDATEAQAGSYAAGTCPDSSVQMVFSTSETDIRTAVQAIDKAAKIGRDKGYNVKVLKGDEATVQAFKNWFSCENLVLLGRVGHGTEQKIIVDDGELTYSYFQSLDQDALENKIVYFNSCLVHNDPLEPAIVAAGVQKYIGGDVNLSIGASEDVFTCFMDRVISDGDAMSTSLEECEKEHYYYKGQVRGTDGLGDHGISGSGIDYLEAQAICSADNMQACSDSNVCVDAGLNWCTVDGVAGCQVEDCTVTPECDANNPERCETEETCTNVDLNWCTTDGVSGCQSEECSVVPKCDSAHPELCNTEDTCVNTGLNWCMTDGTYGCQVSDCEEPPINSENLALYAQVRASSQYSLQYKGENVTDGDSTTAWASRRLYSPYQREWIRLNLGSETKINEVNIDWAGNEYAQDFVVWAWVDNRWLILQEVQKSSEGPSIVSFSSVTAQYVIITMQQGTPWSYFTINEIVVY